MMTPNSQIRLTLPAVASIQSQGSDGLVLKVADTSHQPRLIELPYLTPNYQSINSTSSSSGRINLTGGETGGYTSYQYHVVNNVNKDSPSASNVFKIHNSSTNVNLPDVVVTNPCRPASASVGVSTLPSTVTSEGQVQFQASPQVHRPTRPQSSIMVEHSQEVIQRIREILNPHKVPKTMEWQNGMTHGSRARVLFKILTCMLSGPPSVGNLLDEKYTKTIKFTRWLELNIYTCSSSMRNYDQYLALMIQKLAIMLQQPSELTQNPCRPYQRLQAPINVSANPGSSAGDSKNDIPIGRPDILNHLHNSLTSFSGYLKQSIDRSSQIDAFKQTQSIQAVMECSQLSPRHKRMQNHLLLSNLRYKRCRDDQDVRDEGSIGKKLKFDETSLELRNIMGAPSPILTDLRNDTLPLGTIENQDGSQQRCSSTKSNTSPSETYSGKKDKSQVAATSFFLLNNPEIHKEMYTKNPMTSVKVLQSILEGPLTKLFDFEPESAIFKLPVDVKALKVPNYYEVVKNPMDLTTIKNKLEQGCYNEPWEFIDDVFQMFDNAWYYNIKNSRAFRASTKLANFFVDEMQPLMGTLGYCCGYRYTFYPTPLSCMGKAFCQIGKEAKYYHYENTYYYCEKCFNAIKTSRVKLPRQSGVPEMSESEIPERTVSKDDFEAGLNDGCDVELFVNCDDCGRKFHKICVLHLDSMSPQGFVCDTCLAANGKNKVPNVFTAKNLAQTEMGSFIESRVNRFLQENQSGASDVVVRVLSNYKKVVKTGPRMAKRYFDNSQSIPSFPYTLKSIFAFQEEVCFFGMHVQEYGSDCPLPNSRRVYIAYLDSVNFFRPREFRTSVYHEILLGYLDYVKRLGFTTAHLWASPAAQGNDYIFFCHPPDQKFPNSKRLQDWYTTLLQKAVDEELAVKFMNILDYVIEEQMKSVTEMPYFDGDIFQDFIETHISAAEVSEETSNARREKKSKVRGNPLAHAKKYTKLQVLDSDEISLKLLGTVYDQKNTFFVIRLHSGEYVNRLGPIVDPDPLLDCEVMNGRDVLLTMCAENQYEFSSQRRARYSTMAMLFEIHRTVSAVTCNSCGIVTDVNGIGLHCAVCPDFDLCTECVPKVGHSHQDGDNIVDVEAETKMMAKSKLLKISAEMAHSFNCKSADCYLPNCPILKTIEEHVKDCSVKCVKNCNCCQQFIEVLKHHIYSCKSRFCKFPLCPVLKPSFKVLVDQPRPLNFLHRKMGLEGPESDDCQPTTSTRTK